MDTAVAKGSLLEETTLLRGVSSEAESILSLKEGQGFVDKGFVSTSASASFVNEFMAFDTDPREGALLRITAPAGTPAAFLGFTGAQDRMKEQEVLLPRNSVFSVTKDTPATDTSPRVIELAWRGVKK